MAEPLPTDQVNLTGEESRIVPVAGCGFEQCYITRASVGSGSLFASRSATRTCSTTTRCATFRCWRPASAKPARRFAGFAYAARDSGTRERRAIVKGEQIGDETNPRFVVSTLPGAARHLYEEVYGARGDMGRRTWSTRHQGMPA